MLFELLVPLIFGSNSKNTAEAVFALLLPPPPARPGPCGGKGALFMDNG